MRIVSWNCKGALDRKWENLQSLRPDLSIVQECASPAVLTKLNLKPDPNQCLWSAKSGAKDKNKGLGVFAADCTEMWLAPCWPDINRRWAGQPYRLDVLLPVEVLQPRRMNVLAVWSFNNRGKPGRRQMPGPILVGIQELQDWLLEVPSLVIGDFNNHRRWDTPVKQNNFSHHLAAFDKISFKSAYHALNQIEHDNEPDRTHLSQVNMSYHIDYAFAPESVLSGASCQVAPLQLWCGKGGLSDHSPLILDIRSIEDLGDKGMDTIRNPPPGAGAAPEAPVRSV